MWQIDKTTKTSYFQQIITLVIDQIQQGKLAPGDRLPPERKLAELLGVNRSTVNHALDELASLGWLTRKQGSGTEVAKGRLGSRQTPANQWRNLLRSIPPQDPYIHQLTESKLSGHALDLYTGDLPVELIPDFQFPTITWEQVMQDEKKSDLFGYQPLKEILHQRLQQQFQLTLTPQEILITSGATQGISLILQTLLQLGDSIATEDPSFLFALPLFQNLGLQLIGIKCDAEGIDPQELEEKILTKKIKLLYLNPSFQNPTGRSMSLPRRKAILALCQKYSVPIIEDDVFGELSFVETLPRLKSLAPDQVIYLGSLSKIFSSTIKIGWIVAPAPLLEQIAQAKQRLEADTNIFSQLLANQALRETTYQLHHQQLIQQLQQRSQAFCQQITPLAKEWHFQPIKGGMYYWLTWRKNNLTRKDWQLFLEQDVLVAPSFLFSNETNSMRLNYTRLAGPQLDQFTEKMHTITNQLKERS